MKVTNTVGLKNQANKLLKDVMKGNPVIITFRGKPAASLLPLNEEGLEDFILENSPKIRKMIGEAKEDVAAGKTISFDAYLNSL
jgi:antitoxin (DNA-binding transcriptional repressor) of toxin-antitoxin stability system